MKWKFIGSCFGDSFVIDGVDIFKVDWESTGETAEVIDPLYKQPFRFEVWKITTINQTITFAAGEFSNSVFGIYRK